MMDLETSNLKSKEPINFNKKNTTTPHYSSLDKKKFMELTGSIISGYYENDCLYGLKKIPPENMKYFTSYILKKEKKYNLICPKKLDSALQSMAVILNGLIPSETLIQAHRKEANDLVKYFAELIGCRFIRANNYKPGLITNPTIPKYQHTAGVLVFHNMASHKLIRDVLLLNSKKRNNKIPLLGLNNLVQKKEFAQVGYFNNFSQKSLKYLLWRLYNLIAIKGNLKYLTWDNFFKN